MPAVESWWQLPEDEEEFLEYVSKTGDVVAVPDRYVLSRADLDPIAMSELITKGQSDSCALGLRHLIFKRGINELTKDGCTMFGLPLQADYALYNRCKFVDGTLTLSNLYAQWSFPTNDFSAMVDKDPEFRKWATKLFGWIRRHTPERVSLRGFQYRATQRVSAAIREGRIVVELY